MTELKHFKAKVCLVGDKAVGKTSLVRRYVLDQFDDQYLLTLGSKVTKKVVDVALPEADLQVQIDLSIWDIMGQVGLRDVMKEAYFYGTSAVLAVADRTRRDSLDGIREWFEAVHGVAGPVPAILAVNKNDLVGQAAYTVRDADAVARGLGCGFLLTSAKTGENVETAFQRIGELIVRHRNVA